MPSSDPIATLLETYHDLNPSVVEEFPHQNEEPSPLEFLRYVSRNRPCVFRGAARRWPAQQKWDARFLRDAMRGRKVRVAVTPAGNADAVVEQANGELVFTEPHEIEESFEDFLDDVQNDSSAPPSQKAKARNVKYAQTQNNNLPNEYSPLTPDLPPTLPFARIALNQSAEEGPEALNFWLGNARSTTALHKDNYENLYVAVRGRKHFVLLAPVEMACVNEGRVRRGRFVPDFSSSSSFSASSGAGAVDDDDGSETLKVEIDKDGEPLPVPLWDPDDPLKHTTPYSHLARPLRVTLYEGDMLYLPAMWYHKVTQSVGAEGFACAVNYWYDMAFDSAFWASNCFLRDVVEAGRQRVVYPELDLAGEEEGGT